MATSSRTTGKQPENNRPVHQCPEYSPGKLEVLDQLRLLHKHYYDVISTSEEASDCIKSMRVRGAPTIEIVASFAHAVELHSGSCAATKPEETVKHIDSCLDLLKESRPTAVDLSNAINLLKTTVRQAQISNAWLQAQHNARPDNKISVLTHCNIGAVIIGTDRVIRNGDTANKIGTYSFAVLARFHGIKFVVAPTTSIDLDTETR
ncbi:hypothetical protein GGS23DRAFT_592841 [Durotheca rogersii]|uniref:uncharacterized protein n=1 Tax=Durotheca rogersii TaxID=419775 RepID=UPI0022207B2B|nr:uncharacterized protein GGS23DRAFT_592841 [Durotheca rogersii]KAI5867533.1 hypothetical protein GGS23DRAFT_592841 [Durotheca rogersii]